MRWTRKAVGRISAVQRLRGDSRDGILSQPLRSVIALPPSPGCYKLSRSDFEEEMVVQLMNGSSVENALSHVLPAA
jgi:hypothetical protein